MKKKKVYILMISKTFPATHPRRGKKTFFKEKIQRNCVGGRHHHISFDPFTLNVHDFPDPKLHTIRLNYELWKKRAEKINAGEAVLSLRQWSGSPYNYARDGSKQVEFMRLEKIGIESIKIISGPLAPGLPKCTGVFVGGSIKNIHEVAKNDGLSVDDFCNWFKKDIDGCVIHFTNFLYS